MYRDLAKKYLRPSMHIPVINKQIMELPVDGKIYNYQTDKYDLITPKMRKDLLLLLLILV